MNCSMEGATSTVGQFALRSLLSDEAIEHVAVLALYAEMFPIGHDKLMVMLGDLLGSVNGSRQQIGVTRWCCYLL